MNNNNNNTSRTIFEEQFEIVFGPSKVKVVATTFCSFFFVSEFCRVFSFLFFSLLFFHSFFLSSFLLFFSSSLLFFSSSSSLLLFFSSSLSLFCLLGDRWLLGTLFFCLVFIPLRRNVFLNLGFFCFLSLSLFSPPLSFSLFSPRIFPFLFASKEENISYFNNTSSF